tara:strand:+ start:76446 stop:76868 length:423 start_codon:yes stop_codon:yes gene_type:complete
MYKLSKKFRFETAHRLAKGYVGKCSNIHGHSWNGEISVSCSELNSVGMAIDFSDLKTVCSIIEDIFDHKLVLYKDDPIKDELDDFPVPIFYMNDNPTSEVIGKYILDKARDLLIEMGKGNLRDLCVVVEETCTSRCEVSY